MTAQISHALVLIFLAAAAYEDARTRTLPVPLLVAGALAGLMFRLLSRTWDSLDIMAGTMTGFLLLVLAFAGREAIGYGDGLVLSATGIFLGGLPNLMLLFWSLLASAVCAGLLLVSGALQRKDRIPFVPFILTGFVLLIGW